MSDDLDKYIWSQISEEQKKHALKKWGILPSVPFVVESIYDDQIYSVSDVAEFLNFSEQHVRRLCKAGKIKSIQITYKGTYKIFGNDIKEFIKKHIKYDIRAQRLIDKYKD